MPKSIKGWLMFAAAVAIVVKGIKMVPQVNQYVGL